MIHLALLLACSSHQPVGPRGVARPDYEAALDDWTRELRLYEHFETELLLRATLMTRPFDQALAHELAWRGGWSAEELSARNTEDRARELESHDLLVAVMKTADGHLKLGADPDADWRLRLYVDGRACAPLSLDALEDPPQGLRALFPAANAWADVWRARFATDCGREGMFVLVVSGPSGSGEITWQVSG